MAKKDEKKKSSRHELRGATSDEERQVNALSINGNKRPSNNADLSSDCPISKGVQNIALAHLLVTHILLWLMKLNSISLFQAIEHQHQHQFPSSSNKLQTNHKLQAFDTQSNPSLASLDNFLSVKNSDSTEQLTREELENILRRKLPRLNSTTSPKLANETANEQKRNQSISSSNLLHANSNETFNLFQSEPIATRADNSTALSIQPKNERGLRETMRIPLSEFNLTDLSPVNKSSVSTSVSMSRAQLMNLINLSSNNQRDLLQPQQMLNSSSLFKSSLPKRMTAFRQAKPNANITSTSKMSTNNLLDSERIDSVSTSRKPKQRARVLISHPESDSSEEPKRRSNDKMISTTDKPFPSVETDPPAELPTTPSSNQRLIDESPGKINLEKPIEVNKRLELGRDINDARKPKPPNKIPDDEKVDDEKSVDDQGESNESGEDADVDLDSLLPPVPNYNETSDESSNREETIRKLNPESGSKSGQLDELAFAFNEAASTPNLTIEMPILVLRDKSNSSAKPTMEAFTAEPLRREEKSQTGFSDFLLPIVQQYHILIIAILFNMWLDSLNSQEARTESKPSKSNSSWKLIARRNYANNSASSLSDFGSSSAKSSLKGLIAIPIRGNAKSRPLVDSKLMNLNLTRDKLQYASSAIRWPLRQHKHNRSRSMDSATRNQIDVDELTESSLSRRNSLRSSSSEQLLWIPSSQFRSRVNKSPLLARRLSAYSYQSGQSSESQSSISNINGRSKELRSEEANAASNTVCSVFFGLLIVSASLIVILLAIDLLSVLTQCLTQLMSILVCLIGLCLIWRRQTKPNSSVKRKPADRSVNQKREITRVDQTTASLESSKKHRQCFHYLFLLAAYYCGISIALNLNRQHSVHQLLSQQAIQFIQKHANVHPILHQLDTSGPSSISNYLFLFHLVLLLKGLLLIVQVTVQTILIRSSCERTTRELRQVYTFLMFANLSLWAMEICEQQQQLQRNFDAAQQTDRFRLISGEGFSRLAASVVTLSHLYHGLVFMQH